MTHSRQGHLTARLPVTVRLLTFAVVVRAEGRWLIWQRCWLSREAKVSLQALNLHLDSAGVAVLGSPLGRRGALPLGRVAA